MSTPGDHLDRLIERLTRECLNGIVHYQFWRHINDLGRDEPELIETAPAFFRSTFNAHIDCATLRLNRLIDTTRGAVSVYTLLRYAERHPQAFRAGGPDEVKEAVARGRAILGEVEDVLARFRKQRNAYFVHIAGDYFSEPQREVTEEHPVTFRDVHDSLQRIGRLISAIVGPHRDAELRLNEVIGIDESFQSLRHYLRAGVQFEEEYRQQIHRAV
ncbi:hypothetical protein [Rubrivirga sp.]|uniref:AbiU2 domain-containing protein n=1 Tax=Rubrivirga sp. TaxID=1885344 RepID=UPI003B51F83E